ncbi:organic hydroperoxide resistance protein [Streptomyces sp. NPDC058145]|uniref:organic hydroperoxide resistance protein n=1 Tax=Streptomyces sp. NPDC058145 TaxID=3346356 RepID=UPI0036E869BB
MTDTTAVDAAVDTAPDTRPTKIMYVAEATAHGGRDGYVTSQDGHIQLKVAMPSELGGNGDGTNPEQLFAAGYSSCFHNALILVGNRAGYDLTGSTVAAKVGIGPNKHRGYGLAVALSVSLPVLDREVATELVDAAHDVCPYSNATRGNIDVTILLG